MNPDTILSNLDVMPGNLEIIHYENPEFLVYIRCSYLSQMSGMRAFCHWHKEFELIHILDGEMNYHINDKTVLLKKGDSVFVNSKALHFGFHNERRECHYICLVFHPSMITENLYFRNQYLLPIMENPNLDFIHFQCNTDSGFEVGKSLQNFWDLKQNLTSPYEILLLKELHHLWSYIYKSSEECFVTSTQENSEQLIQKIMVSFIQDHFSEAISLNEIAASGNISRSKCCILFKKFIHQSPIEFLNTYRLQRSCYMLEETELKITQIALLCGFNHPSYFSKQFQSRYGITPYEYRKSKASLPAE